MGTFPFRRLLTFLGLAGLVAALIVALFGHVAAAGEPLSVGEPVRQRGPVIHEPPVDAPVVDPFRQPENPFGPGNRGIEYGPTSGHVVRASAGGVVTFAGSVAGNLFVTVAHDGSLRTTVGFLEQVLVSPGDAVVQGQPIAIGAASLHFSARVDGLYIDPATLFQRFEVHVRLVG